MIEQQIVVTIRQKGGAWAITNSSHNPSLYTNARLKAYPGKTVIQVANSPIFLYTPGEPVVREYDVSPPGQAEDPIRALEESQRRAAAKVRDIALCNRFEYFFTWTLDGTLIDRYDPDIVYSKVHSFLNNAVRRKNFAYVLVPEYHKIKPGETTPAIHMHGLCILGQVPIVWASNKSGQPLSDKQGRPIYNMPTWTWGFSTCVPIDHHYERTINYLVKYITKSDEKIFGKWYLSSRNLIKSPELIPLDPIRYDDFRDKDKLKTHEQREISLYENVRLLTEELPPIEPEIHTD